ncbi:uncharacterized protein LOC122507444 [Leptopilina heterotoma]|uniref:uncharacterized protein LOC122507444 n=1 Tax=Leptopilina heterotoma TaxID=63436 RepID=UPI001CAA1838|nr:uncharacterized protein LOC122507444 [Leptopilina heterotoma]XP_043476091.1 uncharacterized protein LOC122507444 [Leptopilina heterotoma]
MMKGNIEIYSQNFLRAEQLLLNKGIRCNTVDEYERYSQLLPKTGKKLFEPKCTWLESKKIEKDLQYRSDLLAIERVERKSQIAFGEWLPNERKVQVLKRAGQVWANFGFEVNSILYLNPEEALSLLEMNCIELLWEKVPLSVQQAYAILLNADKSGCSLDNYRVYNQFVRYGYRLLRHSGNKLTSSKGTSVRQSFRLKPVVIPPSNGLRKFGTSSEVSDNEKIKGNVSTDGYSQEEVEISSNNDNIIDDCVHQVMENIVCHLESKRKSESNSLVGDVDVDVEVIPNCIKSKKRKHLENSNEINLNNHNKKKKTEIITTDQASKKQGQEVICLSDDEIEEICKPATRLDVLNQLPDVASQSVKIQSKNLKSYLPRGIELKRDVYYFEKIKCPTVHKTDNCNNTFQNTSSKRNLYALKHNNPKSYAKPYSTWNQNAQCANRFAYQQINGAQRGFHTVMQGANRLSRFQCFLYFNFLAYNNYRSATTVTASFMKYNLMRNFYAPNYRSNFCNPPVAPCQNLPSPRLYNKPHQSKELLSSASNANRGSIIDNKKEPSSWQQFKQKLQDEHTITIDDEHSNEKKVDGQNKNIKPLINIKRSAYSFDVNDKIKLIKPFVKKSQQKKAYDSKVSYNIYSNNANYRKANPGPPNSQLLVVRENSGHYLDSEEVHHSLITKDKTLVLAYVTKTSISYIQFGSVEIPDLL